MLAGLDAFLIALKARDLVIGPSEIERLHRLFDLAPELDDDALRELIASVVVKSVEQREAFEDEFRFWIGQRPPERRRTSPPSIRRSTTTPSRTISAPEQRAERRWVRRALVGTAAALVAIVTLILATRPAPEISEPTVAGVAKGPPGRVSWKPSTEEEAERFVAYEPKGNLRRWVPEVYAPPQPVWKDTRWQGALLALLASAGGLACWLRFLHRTKLPAPAPIPHDGPAWVPLLPPELAGPQVLDPDALRTMVWGIGRFVSEDLTGRIDVPQTVDRTAKNGAIPVIVPEHATWQREVWIWQDDEPEEASIDRVAIELVTVLQRAGLPYRRGFFAGVPDLIRYENGEELSPLVIEGHRQNALVVILTTSPGLARHLQSDLEAARTRNLLRSLAEWPWLAFADFAAEERPLSRYLAPYRIPCLAPDEIPGFLSTAPVPPRTSTRPRRAWANDLRAWEAAGSLGPGRLDLKTALALRHHLGLDLPLPALDALSRRDGVDLAGFGSLEAARHARLNWLSRAEPPAADGHLNPESTLARALSFWRERLDAEQTRRAASESALLPWDETGAHQRLRMEAAFLDLWDHPTRAAEALHTLSGGFLERTLRRRLSTMTGRTKGSRAPEDGAALLLPWPWESLSPRIAWLLRKLGLGSALETRVAGNLRKPPALLLALGLCTGLFTAALGDALRRAPPPPARQSFGSDLLPMVELPGGHFLMGSPDGDTSAFSVERPQHAVKVSPFAVGKFLVTRQLYREIMGKQPKRWEGDSNDDRLPANSLSWFDAIAFCNALSDREGLARCYEKQGGEWGCNWSADGYRLPTEAEWEYAARAGTTTKWWWGDDERGRDRHASPETNISSEAHAIPDPERLSPEDRARINAFGLHGMVGNVYQWCWDLGTSEGYPDVASGSTAEDPKGPVSGPAPRRFRGGAYWDETRLLRSACRGRGHPAHRDKDVGFRCVRAPRRQHP